MRTSKISEVFPHVNAIQNVWNKETRTLGKSTITENDREKGSIESAKYRIGKKKTKDFLKKKLNNH